MKNGKKNPIKVKFHRKNDWKNVYVGFILAEDNESVILGVDFEGTEATLVCFYDEWEIIKYY